LTPLLGSDSQGEILARSWDNATQQSSIRSSRQYCGLEELRYPFHDRTVA